MDFIDQCTIQNFLYKGVIMKIRARYISGKWSRRLNDYGPKRDMFEKYVVHDIRSTDSGNIITVNGPKVTYTLMPCKNPLKIVDFDEKTNTRKDTFAPLYYVSPFTGGGKIKHATHFAEINGELIAYTTSGRGFITEV